MSAGNDVSLISKFSVGISGQIVSINCRVLNATDLVRLVVEITDSTKQLLSVITLQLHVPALRCAEVDILPRCLSVHSIPRRQIVLLQILV